MKKIEFKVAELFRHLSSVAFLSCLLLNFQTLKMLAVCPSASCAEQDLIKLAFQFKTHTHIETFEAEDPRKNAKGTPWTG